MKNFLICLFQVVLVCGLASCEKGLERESDFITPGEHPDVPGNPLWDWSDTYPGPVNASLDVLSDTTIKVIGQYKPLPYAPETPILQSTGLYAGIDNIINVDVPANAVGLKYQIGLAQRLAPDQGQRRYGDVVKKGSLEPGRINQISSNFGGYIYFYYEPKDVASAPAEVLLHVSNAYQSYDYIKGSDPEVQRTYVRIMKERSSQLKDTSIGDDQLVFLNWTELRSPKVILTFSVKEMDYLTSPEKLLQQYENLVDAFLEFAGYGKAEDYELPLFRVYADIQLPNPKQKKVANADGTPNYDQDERKYGGYPIGVLKDVSMRGAITDKADEKRYMSQDDQLAFGYNNGSNTVFAGTQYAFGITVLGEWAKAARIKYPLLRVANHYYSQYISGFGSFWGSRGYTEQAAQWRAFIKGNRLRTPYQDLNTLNSWYMGSYESDNTKNGDVWGKPNAVNDDVNARNEGRRASVFMQLIQQYGWGIIKYVNQRCVEVGFKNEYEQDAHDFFVMAACEYADADLRPFFRWWQFPFTAHAVKFIRQQGFPPLQKEYQYTIGEGDNAKTYDFYFFDWPGSIIWFPNDKPQVNPDKWTDWSQIPRKAATWPEKAYYSDVVKETEWVGYGEIVQANPNWPDPTIAGQNWVVEYKPEMWRPAGTDKNLLTKAGFLASTYLWFNVTDNGSDPKTENRLKARLYCEATTGDGSNGSWRHGTPGAIGALKGGTGITSGNNNPDRGSDTTINWAILDIDFQKPVRFNAIKTRQDFNSENNFAQFILGYQYYVEPEYTIPADPNDPTSEPVQVKTGFIVDEGYVYDPQNDPRRVIWKGYNHPDNNVPYPGRTMNMNDNAPLPNNSNQNIPAMKTGNWGFHPKDANGNPQAYFALVTPKPALKDHSKSNKVKVDDQDWYTGVTWLVRDNQNRSYVYYFEETIETRRIRFFLRPAINHRLGDPMSFSTNGGDADKSWRLRLQEIYFGLVSTDIPAPGSIPAPHEFYKGAESGDYPNVTPRNYGGGAPNHGW